MTRFKIALIALSLLIVAPALAQWQTPLNTIPVGRGPGVTGFHTVGGSGGAGAKCLVDTLPPTYVPCNTLTVGCPNVLSYGGKGDNSTDNHAAILAALNSNTNQACVFFPPGVYRVNSSVSWTINGEGVTFVGSGQDTTELTWPNGSDGFDLTNGTSSRFRFSQMSITTSQVQAGIGLRANFTAASSDPNFIENVSFRGADAYEGSQQWNTCMAFNGVWNINISHVYCVLGLVGIQAGGQVTPPVATAIMNITDSTFNFQAQAVQYNGYFQGVTIKGSNFNGCSSACIVTGASTTGANQQDQLAIIGNQIAPFDGAPGILFVGAMRDPLISSNLFLVGPTSDAILAFNGSEPYFAAIVGNSFGTQAGSSNVAIHLLGNAGTNASTITSNSFFGFGTGILLGASTSGWNVQSNAFVTVSTPITNSAGSANHIGIISSDLASGLTYTAPILSGKVAVAGSAPTISACGGSPSVLAGSSDFSGSFQVGTAITACILTFSSAFISTPNCMIVDSAGVVPTYAVTTTAINVTTTVASHFLHYSCVGT